MPTALPVSAGIVIQRVAIITARHVPTAGRILRVTVNAVNFRRGSAVLISGATFICMGIVMSPKFIRRGPSEARTLGSQRRVAPSVRAEGGRINVVLMSGSISIGELGGRENVVWLPKRDRARRRFPRTLR